MPKLASQANDTWIPADAIWNQPASTCALSAAIWSGYAKATPGTNKRSATGSTAAHHRRTVVPRSWKTAPKRKNKE